MERHVSRLRSCIHPWMGHTMSARQGETLFQEIDGSTISTPDPHTMHSGHMARNSSMISKFYVRCNSGHTRQVDLQSFGRPLYSEQKGEPRQEEPDYDLPTESIFPSPHPSRSDAPHEDEGTAQAKSRMRRPAPQSIEEERKIKPFAKKPITFMFPCYIWRKPDQHHGARAEIWEIPVEPFGGERTSTWHASTTFSLMTKRQKPH